MTESDIERDARFTPLNDRIWGRENWVRCPTCPHDNEGREVYHHRDAHARSNETINEQISQRVALKNHLGDWPWLKP